MRRKGAQPKVLGQFCFQTRLLNLRQKYIGNLIHKNKVQQKHIRNQEEYRTAITKRLAREDERTTKIRHLKQKERLGAHKRGGSPKLFTRQQSLSQSYQEPEVRIANCVSLNSSQFNIHKTPPTSKFRLNTLKPNKRVQQQNYSQRLMKQNLQRLDRSEQNRSMIKESRAESLNRLVERRKKVVDKKQRLVMEKQNQAICSLGAKLFIAHQRMTCKQPRGHDQKDDLKEPEATSRSLQRKDNVQPVRTEFEFEFDRKTKVNVEKQINVLDSRQESLMRIKARITKEQSKASRVKENRQEKQRLMREQSNNVVEEHKVVTRHALKMKAKLEKYRQDKIMMDFLSHDHTARRC